MKRDDSVYPRHMLDAISRIEEYSNGVGEDTFHNSTLIQDGVIRQLEIVGEAVKHLSFAFREKHFDVPCQDIAGTRDMLSHHYFGISLDEVWLMVERDIPVLKAKIIAPLANSSA